MARRNIIADILGGQFMLNSSINRHWPYILFVFGLAILHVFLRFSSKDLLVRQERNNKFIKELKTEDSSKKILLLELSKQEEIQKLLQENHLDLKNPEDPPYLVRKFK